MAKIVKVYKETLPSLRLIGKQNTDNDRAPDGYMCVDIRGGEVGTCWIHGRDETGELYGPPAFDMCLAAVQGAGWQMADAAWCFERYDPVRFRTPDEDGNVILDFGIELKA